MGGLCFKYGQKELGTVVDSYNPKLLRRQKLRGSQFEANWGKELARFHINNKPDVVACQRLQGGGS
jgi:hypothetical protein